MSRPAPHDGNGVRRAYLALLSVSFGAWIAVNASGLGPFALGAAALALAGIILSIFSDPMRWATLARFPVVAASALALAFPVGQQVMAGAPVPVAIQGNVIWPQLLVTLFAGRALAADCDQRFLAFWREPERAPYARTQSLAAAIATGLFLTLSLYALLGLGASPAPTGFDPWSIVRRALVGETFVHVAIVTLFAIVLAAIIDAALVLASDLHGLATLRHVTTTHREGPLGTYLQDETHTRPVQELLGQHASLAALHLSARRLIRALISFLPLLGFLGTVIGLTAAIGGLPQNLGPEAQGNIDITASLVGLSVKFETTLLGLVGALLASVLLALVERRETEMAAQTRHLLEMARHG